MAVDNNPDLAVSRYDPAISETEIASARSAFVPTVRSGLQRNSELLPPVNLFGGVAGTQTDLWTGNVGVTQQLPWGGGNYLFNWDSSRTTSNSIISSFSPALASTLQVAFSQPLLRDFKIDPARAQLDLSKRNREIADTRYTEAAVTTTADAERAVLAARIVARAGRCAATVARSRIGAGAHEPGTRRCRSVAAARPRGRASRSRAAQGELDHRSNQRPAV